MDENSGNELRLRGTDICQKKIPAGLKEKPRCHHQPELEGIQYATAHQTSGVRGKSSNVYSAYLVH